VPRGVEGVTIVLRVVVNVWGRGVQEGTLLIRSALLGPQLGNTDNHVSPRLAALYEVGNPSLEGGGDLILELNQEGLELLVLEGTVDELVSIVGHTLVGKVSVELLDVVGGGVNLLHLILTNLTQLPGRGTSPELSLLHLGVGGDNATGHHMDKVLGVDPLHDLGAVTDTVEHTNDTGVKETVRLDDSVLLHAHDTVHAVPSLVGVEVLATLVVVKIGGTIADKAAIVEHLGTLVEEDVVDVTLHCDTLSDVGSHTD